MITYTTLWGFLGMITILKARALSGFLCEVAWVHALERGVLM